MIPTPHGPEMVIALLQSSSVRADFTEEQISIALRLIYQIGIAQELGIIDILNIRKQAMIDVVLPGDAMN